MVTKYKNKWDGNLNTLYQYRVQLKQQKKTMVTMEERNGKIN